MIEISNQVFIKRCHKDALTWCYIYVNMILIQLIRVTFDNAIDWRAWKLLIWINKLTILLFISTAWKTILIFYFAVCFDNKLKKAVLIYNIPQHLFLHIIIRLHHELISFIIFKSFLHIANYFVYILFFWYFVSSIFWFDIHAIKMLFLYLNRKRSKKKTSLYLLYPRWELYEFYLRSWVSMSGRAARIYARYNTCNCSCQSFWNSL